MNTNSSFMVAKEPFTKNKVKKDLAPEAKTPTINAGKKITIMPYSATVVESEGNGAQLPPNLALFLKKKDRD
jgi:hypothetical protein